MGNHWEHYLREITLHKLCLSLLIHVSVCLSNYLSICFEVITFFGHLLRHIFAIGNGAYSNMRTNSEDQCIVIRYEWEAGKGRGEGEKERSVCVRESGKKEGERKGGRERKGG